MAGEHQYCTFYVDGHYLGVDVRTVQEIIRYQPMTRVPLAPAEVRGLINLRGQIVTAIDLRRRLELKERPNDEQPINVVVRTEDGAVSLLVDEIGDVLEVPEKQFERPPETLKGTPRELIRGAYKLDGRLMLVLDTERTVALAGIRGQESGGRDQGEEDRGQKSEVRGQMSSGG
jgi:purine-binding chemotaxis protein CheW